MISRLTINRIIKYVFQFTGILVIILLGAIFLMLIWNSFSFFLEKPLRDYMTGRVWNPDESYSFVPLIISTLFVAIGSMLIAVPLGILTAAYLSELAPPRVKNILKPIIEMLAAIPSVAIGFLGIVLVGPFIAQFFNLSNGLNALNGSILLAVMALPTIVTICEDSISAVPKDYKEASYALGANRWQTLFQVILPAAKPGLIAAVMLGLGRALGETMTVLMATGNSAAIPSGFLDSIRTITATIAIEMGEVPYQTTHYYALFAIAAILFIITLGINMIGERYARKSRKFRG